MKTFQILLLLVTALSFGSQLVTGTEADQEDPRITSLLKFLEGYYNGVCNCQYHKKIIDKEKAAEDLQRMSLNTTNLTVIHYTVTNLKFVETICTQKEARNGLRRVCPARPKARTEHCNSMVYLNTEASPMYDVKKWRCY